MAAAPLDPLAAYNAAAAVVAGTTNHGGLELYLGGNPAFAAFSSIPNMVNGDVATFQRIYITAGLQRAFRVVPDAVFANVAHPDTTAGVMVRAELMAAIHNVLLVNAFPDAAQRAAFSLVMSAARVAQWKAFQLADGNYIASQVLEQIGTFTAAGVFVPPAGGAVTGLTADAVAASLVVIRAVADGDTLMAKAAKLGLGIPVLQGCTAVSTGEHHFVPETKEWFRTFIQSVLGKGETTITPLSQENFEDALCHKSAHPIATMILVGAARSVRVKMALNALGLSGATARMPALTPTEKACGAVVRLDQAFRASAAVAHVGLPVLAPGQTSYFAPLAVAVSLLVSGVNYALGEPEATELLNTRVMPHAWYIGYALGYQTAQFKATKKGDKKDTLGNSKFLQRVAAEATGSEAAGAERYEEVRKYIRAKAGRGGLVGVSLMGGTAPADLEDPDAADRRARAAAVVPAPPAAAAAPLP